MNETTFVDFKAPVMSMATEETLDGGDPESALILAGGGGGTSKTGVLNYVNVYEFKTQMSGLACVKAFASFAQDDMVTSLAMSPDGKLVAMGVGETPECTVFNFTKSKKALAKLTSFRTDFKDEDPCQNAVIFSPCGTRIATGGDDGVVRVWKLAGSLVGSSKVAATAKAKAKSSAEGEAKVTDDKTKADAATGDKATGEATSGDAAAGKKEEETADAATGSDADSGGEEESKGGATGTLTSTRLAECKGHTKGVNDLCYHPSGKWVLSSSDDYTLRLWDASGKAVCVINGYWEKAQGGDLRKRRRKDGTWRYKGARFSPDGKALYALETSRRGPAAVVKYNEPDGGWAQGGAGTLTPSLSKRVYHEPVVSMTVSADGAFIGLGGSDGCVIVLSSGLVKLQRVAVHDLAVTSLVFHAHTKGLCLVSGSAARSLAVTRIRTKAGMSPFMVIILALLVLGAATLVLARVVLPLVESGADSVEEL